MASDLRIEVFSVDLYRNLWRKFGLVDFVLPRLKNYDNVTTEIACSDAIILAVLCRHSFFSPLIWNEIYYDSEEFSKSSLDFYLYIENNMDKFIPYNELIVFDKLLMICAVILEMGYACSTRSNTTYLYNCPLCFAMHFDTKYKEEFYTEGGWRVLENYAKTYEARVITHPKNNQSSLCYRTAYNEAILYDYSFDRVKRVFQEKSMREKSQTSCPRCLPLFHIIRWLSGTSDEFLTQIQLAEGFLQIILHMLSHQDLLEGEKLILQGTKFKNKEEIIKITNSHLNTKIQQKNQETKPVEKWLELLVMLKDQNTLVFLDRLFQTDDDQDDTGDQCMFCACSMKELPKVSKSVSDIQVERIKSKISDTEIDVNLKGDESTEVSFEADKMKKAAKKKDTFFEGKPKEDETTEVSFKADKKKSCAEKKETMIEGKPKDETTEVSFKADKKKRAAKKKATKIKGKLKEDESAEVSFEAGNKKSAAKKEDNDINGVLKLFFALGVEPLKSNILINLNKSSSNQNNMDKLADSFAKIKINKAQDDEVKGIQTK